MHFFDPPRGSFPLYAVMWLTMAGVLLATLPGCGGCRRTPTSAQKRQEDEEELLKKKKQEKPKPDFEVGRLQILPVDSVSRPAGDSDGDGRDSRNPINQGIRTNPIKPGHWITAAQEIKANNFDFQAELLSSCVDARGNPLLIERTPFAIRMSRPAALPKGQQKNFEAIYSIPRVAMRRSAIGDTQISSRRIMLQSQLRARRGGRVVAESPELTTLMPAFQYFMVVLAEQPDSYGFLKMAAAVDPPDDEFNVGESIRYYQVAMPAIDRRVPLPSHPLTWTSIAHIVWDGVNPRLMAPDQEDAMLDWLHWGGQLIVSGPRSLDLLRGSFLEPYLPAVKGETKQLRADDFARVNERWSLESKKHKQRMTLDVLDERPPLGVTLTLHGDGQFMPDTGQLMAERRVGGGRLVVTAFSVNDPLIVTNWKSFDNFLNNALLRLPPRQFRTTQDLVLVTEWAGGFRGLERDARLTSNLRYFSRDIGQVDGSVRQVESGDERKNPLTDDWRFAGYAQGAESGVAGWNDFSGAATAARESLREAAGISIPRAGFVWRVMAIYLIALVPLNWGFFWMIGRVEWAWLMAPVIAIAGAVAVVKLAQLDIGFARSLTQVAVLEAQADYPRAHVTRYAALYTSLSTSYDVVFDDASALAQPFSDSPDFQMGAHDSVKTVAFRRDRDVSLSGFTVDSNQADMLHCEQMLPIQGVFSLNGDANQGWKVINGTMVDLHDAVVLRRTTEDTVELAWVGDLASNTAAPLKFAPAPEKGRLVARWDQSDTMKHGRSDGEIRLGRLADSAAERLRLLPGDVRLIGWSGEELPGTAFRPEASQNMQRTLVLVHLKRTPLPDLGSDRNLLVDVRDDVDLDDALDLFGAGGNL